MPAGQVTAVTLRSLLTRMMLLSRAKWRIADNDAARFTGKPPGRRMHGSPDAPQGSGISMKGNK